MTKNAKEIAIFVCAWAPYSGFWSDQNSIKVKLLTFHDRVLCRCEYQVLFSCWGKNPPFQPRSLSITLHTKKQKKKKKLNTKNSKDKARQIDVLSLYMPLSLLRAPVRTCVIAFFCLLFSVALSRSCSFLNSQFFKLYLPLKLNRMCVWIYWR